MPEKPRSVPGKSKKFAVQPSPFNLIKLELGIILIVGILWGIGVGILVSSRLLQLALFILYGFGAMAWLIARTAHVLKRHASDSRDPDD